MGTDGQGQVQDNCPDSALQSDHRTKYSAFSLCKETWTPRTPGLTWLYRLPEAQKPTRGFGRQRFCLLNTAVPVAQNAPHCKLIIQQSKKQKTLLSNEKAATQFTSLELFL